MMGLSFVLLGFLGFLDLLGFLGFLDFLDFLGFLDFVGFRDVVWLRRVMGWWFWEVFHNLLKSFLV